MLSSVSENPQAIATLCFLGLPLNLWNTYEIILKGVCAALVNFQEKSRLDLLKKIIYKKRKTLSGKCQLLPVDDLKSCISTYKQKFAHSTDILYHFVQELVNFKFYW